jgi:hypothetical protein
MTTGAEQHIPHVPRPRDRVPLMAAALLLCAMPGLALAYIDPGTGSMLLQSLLATVAVVLVAGRNAWNWIKNLFRRGKPGPDSEP